MSKSLSKGDFLLQTDWREDKINRIGSEPWLLACDTFHTDFENGGIYCALVPNEAVEIVLSRPSWDFSKGSGLPGCAVYYDGEERVTSYYRFGDDSGIEPLIIYRTFYGIRKSYLELSEEYRHFHNLYHDTVNQQFIKIGDDGIEVVVGRLLDSAKMELRLREVRQFLALKEMHLAVFFDIVRFSQIDPEEIGPEGDPIDFRQGLVCYNFHASPCDFALRRGHRSFSRLLGKKLIPPLSKDQSGMWPYHERQEKHEGFIIDVDEDGAPVTYTCNPDLLANYFGANPGAPHYLTPVFFRREVLAKYYANPEKYLIEDGYLSYAGLWGLRIDNDHPDYVIVFLGDLGRDIPHSEQLYWRSFNMLPDGGVSERCFRRAFLGQFVDPNSPDLKFKHLFEYLQRRWQESFRWQLFRSLSDEDSHLYTALRVPLTDDQAEFDAQVLALTKVLVDSINEKQLAAELGGTQADELGISKLERYLEQRQLPKRANCVAFLRDLQDLRSSGVAHRKGRKYDKVSARFGVGGKDLRKVFEDILSQAADLMIALSDLLPADKS
jgi:hypothetical protein